jgi:MFS family permease
MALFATFGYISSFGVYQDLYVLAGTASSSNVSWIGSTQLWFFVAMGLPAGALLDKGYFKHLILVGSIIYVFRLVPPTFTRLQTSQPKSSLFMLSLAHVDSYYQIFLSQGVGMGIGAGLIYLPAMAVQAHHWKDRRALTMGIVITGTPITCILWLNI